MEDEFRVYDGSTSTAGTIVVNGDEAGLAQILLIWWFSEDSNPFALPIPELSFSILRSSPFAGGKRHHSTGTVGHDTELILARVGDDIGFGEKGVLKDTPGSRQVYGVAEKESCHGGFGVMDSVLCQWGQCTQYACQQHTATMLDFCRCPASPARIEDASSLRSHWED